MNTMRCDSSSTFAAVMQFMRSGLDEAVVTLPPPNRRDAACQDTGAKMVCDNPIAPALYLASAKHIAPESPWRVNRVIAFSHMRRLLPRVLTSVIAMSSRLAASLFREIAANLQLIDFSSAAFAYFFLETQRLIQASDALCRNTPRVEFPFAYR